jgi:hypothetical protein
MTHGFYLQSIFCANCLSDKNGHAEIASLIKGKVVLIPIFVKKAFSISFSPYGRKI